MKKLLTVLVAVSMLASMLALCVSADGMTCMEVQLPKFSAQPTFDGVISEEEWGPKTVHMVTEGAATNDDTEIGSNDEFGLLNTFYWFKTEGFTDELSYDLWLRWDDEFLYIGALVNDPDPHSLPKGGVDIWNGDMIQFIVDTKGPSAVMERDHAGWDYKTEPYNGNRFNKPWSGTDVFNCILGLVKGMNTSVCVGGGGEKAGSELLNEGALGCIGLVENDDDTCTTTYEAAIPWKCVNETLVPKAGDVYGMTLVTACSDSNELNAWLSWGHGVCSAQNDSTQPRGTRGGSQAIVLSDEAVAPAADFPVATEEVTTEEETEPATEAPAKTEAKTEVETDEKGETVTRKNNESILDNNGLSTGALIGIIAGAVVVVAAVVAIIIAAAKKKKK